MPDAWRRKSGRLAQKKEVMHRPAVSLRAGGRGLSRLGRAFRIRLSVRFSRAAARKIDAA
jgi:hypothetical protein